MYCWLKLNCIGPNSLIFISFLVFFWFIKMHCLLRRQNILFHRKVVVVLDADSRHFARPFSLCPICHLHTLFFHRRATFWPTVRTDWVRCWCATVECRYLWLLNSRANNSIQNDSFKNMMISFSDFLGSLGFVNVTLSSHIKIIVGSI